MDTQRVEHRQFTLAQQRWLPIAETGLRDETRDTSRQRHMRAGALATRSRLHVVHFALLMRAGALATDLSYPYSHNLS